MRDFVIRGYMEYTATFGDPSCAQTFLQACALVGPLPLRASYDMLQLLPPGQPWAMLNGTMVGCPHVFANISGSGSNQQASGVFKQDVARPSLVPITPFSVTAGGGDHALQIRTLTSNCIYQYTVSVVLARGGTGDEQPVSDRMLLPCASRTLTLPAPRLPSLAAH